MKPILIVITIISVILTAFGLGFKQAKLLEKKPSPIQSDEKEQSKYFNPVFNQDPYPDTIVNYAGAIRHPYKIMMIDCKGGTISEAIGKALRDYQIEITNDSLFVYDGSRLVGGEAWDNSKLDSIFLKDNY